MLGAPSMASKVRSINSLRAWVSTWMVTSSGMWPPSISSRTKSKSVWEAAGNPTSISLKPIFTRRSHMRFLRVESIGSTRAWFPSRRSTEHHTGAVSIRVPGQVRSGSSTAGYGRYFSNGIVVMGLFFLVWSGASRQESTCSRPDPPRETCSEKHRTPRAHGHRGFGERRYVALAYTRRSRDDSWCFTGDTVTHSAGPATFLRICRLPRWHEVALPMGLGSRTVALWDP